MNVKTILNEEILLDNVYIPSNKISGKFIYDFFKLSMICKYYPEIICIFDCLTWREKLWSSFHYVKVEDVVKKVLNDPNILEEENLKSLNEIISFVFDYDKSLLEKYAFIPDMNNNFHSFKRKRF